MQFHNGLFLFVLCFRMETKGSRRTVRLTRESVPQNRWSGKPKFAKISKGAEFGEFSRNFCFWHGKGEVQSRCTKYNVQCTMYKSGSLRAVGCGGAVVTGVVPSSRSATPRQVECEPTPAHTAVRPSPRGAPRPCYAVTGQGGSTMYKSGSLRAVGCGEGFRHWLAKSAKSCLKGSQTAPAHGGA